MLGLAACGSGARERRLAREEKGGTTLVGTWDARLSLTRPYQLELREPRVKQICGMMGFVENHYTKAASVSPDSAPQLGIYDLDLSLFGLNWRDDDSIPAAEGTAVAAHGSALRAAQNSVTIVLNPGSQERIVLLGRYQLDEIAGRWTAQSARGTASGSFSLTPHDNTRTSSTGCSESR